MTELPQRTGPPAELRINHDRLAVRNLTSLPSTACRLFTTPGWRSIRAMATSEIPGSRAPNNGCAPGTNHVRAGTSKPRHPGNKPGPRRRVPAYSTCGPHETPRCSPRLDPRWFELASLFTTSSNLGIGQGLLVGGQPYPPAAVSPLRGWHLPVGAFSPLARGRLSPATTSPPTPGTLRGRSVQVTSIAKWGPPVLRDQPGLEQASGPRHENGGIEFQPAAR